MDDLREWLDTKPLNYDKGVRLLLQYNRDPLIIALFREEESEFKRKKLRTLIEELIEQRPTASVTNPSPITRRTVPGPLAHTGWPLATADPIIIALWDKAKPLYAELMNLSARIMDVACLAERGIQYQKEEAARMALRIVELDDLLDDIYDQRDHYLQHGHLPEVKGEKPVVVDPIAWGKELLNIQRYIRDYKVKLRNTPTHKNAPKWQQKLKDLAEREAELKTLLNLNDE